MSDLNDPRVFLAAERTLLAWNRTSLTLMAFGFMIERFGLFIEIMMPELQDRFSKQVSFVIGVAFVLLGAANSLIAVFLYRKVLASLTPIEIPSGYWINVGIISNVIISILGVALIVYLFLSAHI